MNQRDKRRRGNELIEFALVTVAVLPMLFGTVVVGLNIARGIQVTQLSRDAGHMFARNVDFSDTNNKNLIVRLADGLGITTTGGNGVVILSIVTFIDQGDCDAAGLSGSACTNLNQYVFTSRITIGDATLRESNFGTPDPTLIDPKGEVADYLRQPSARANGFGAVLTLASGEVAYVSEAYVKSSDYGLPGYSSTGVYARTVF